jgi:hypothetical protein
LDCEGKLGNGMNFAIFLDNLIASSQNLMGTSEGLQQYPPSPQYQTAPGKTKMTMKSRRGRTSFTQAQLSDLETAFSNTHYPDFQTRKELSNRLKIPDDRIQVSGIIKLVSMTIFLTCFWYKTYVIYHLGLVPESKSEI